jgi:hypothetical protein
MLAAVSRGQRRWDDFKGIFSFFGRRERAGGKGAGADAAAGSGAASRSRSRTSRARDARKIARLRAELEEAQGLKNVYVETLHLYHATRNIHSSFNLPILTNTHTYTHIHTRTHARAATGTRRKSSVTRPERCLIPFPILVTPGLS